MAFQRACHYCFIVFLPHLLLGNCRKVFLLARLLVKLFISHIFDHARGIFNLVSCYISNVGLTNGKMHFGSQIQDATCRLKGATKMCIKCCNFSLPLSLVITFRKTPKNRKLNMVQTQICKTNKTFLVNNLDLPKLCWSLIDKSL